MRRLYIAVPIIGIVITVITVSLLLGGFLNNPFNPQASTTVPIQVIKGQGGSVLVLTSVTIQGEGPFAFALDTGASQSVIDRKIIDRLGLPIVGPAGEITGITGSTDARMVRIEQWSLGTAQLPSDEVVTISFPEPNRGQEFQGLLGSDILSQFGAITLDYDNQRLTLHSSP